MSSSSETYWGFLWFTSGYGESHSIFYGDDDYSLSKSSKWRECKPRFIFISSILGTSIFYGLERGLSLYYISSTFLSLDADFFFSHASTIISRQFIIILAFSHTIPLFLRIHAWSFELLCLRICRRLDYLVMYNCFRDFWWEIVAIFVKILLRCQMLRTLSNINL